MQYTADTLLIKRKKSQRMPTEINLKSFFEEHDPERRFDAIRALLHWREIKDVNPQARLNIHRALKCVQLNQLKIINTRVTCCKPPKDGQL